jgi:hypothetical protein
MSVNFYFTFIYRFLFQRKEGKKKINTFLLPLKAFESICLPMLNHRETEAGYNALDYHPLAKTCFKLFIKKK